MVASRNASENTMEHGLASNMKIKRIIHLPTQVFISIVVMLQMRGYVSLQSQLPINTDMFDNKHILWPTESTILPYCYVINLLDSFYVTNQCIGKFLF